MLTYWETLTAVQSNVPVNDSYAQLWGRKSQGGYTVVTYTGTLPAVLTGTKAGYLQRYKIYGNTEQIGTPTPENPIMPSECGEKTENLFDKDHISNNSYINSSGNIAYGSNAFVSDKILVLENREYCLQSLEQKFPGGYYIAFYDEQDNVLSVSDPRNQNLVILIAPIGSKYFMLSGNRSITLTTTTFTEGSAPPTSYIPYGYKLPLTSGSTPVDIYIGDDTLSTEEYIDSGTGKIYRMVSGTLTPVDPPVPFPQIPTSAGSTTISWAGEGLAPSQVELEYEKKR